MPQISRKDLKQVNKNHPMHPQAQTSLPTGAISTPTRWGGSTACPSCGTLPHGPSSPTSHVSPAPARAFSQPVWRQICGSGLSALRILGYVSFWSLLLQPASHIDLRRWYSRSEGGFWNARPQQDLQDALQCSACTQQRQHPVSLTLCQSRKKPLKNCW